MRVVLLGAPGSGKGTHAKLLMEKHKVPQVSTGDLLRDAIRNKTELGLQARAAMEAGQLVPNEVVLGIISNRLADDDAEEGFILDGFPRNLEQACALDELLRSIDKPLQLAILLEVETDILLQRLTGRRTCISCGAVYNVYTSPPMIEDRCDECGDVLKHRPDDNERTIERRLRVFNQQTKPLINYYSEQRKLRTIQSIGDVDDIFSGINKIVSQIDQMDVVEPVEMESVDEIVNAPTAVVTEPLPHVELPELEKKPTKARAQQDSESVPLTRKKTVAKKKTVKKKTAKKKAAPKKKATPKKKAAAKKKTAKKKTVKKVAAKKTVKKSAAKKKVAKKKAAVKKTMKKKIKKKVAKKKAVTKKTTAKKKAVPKKKATPKKKAVAKKKTAKKKTVKKTTAKKKTTKKKVAKKKAMKKKVVKKRAAPKRKAAVKKKTAKKKSVTKKTSAKKKRSRR